jgi:Transposase DDE domain group 1
MPAGPSLHLNPWGRAWRVCRGSGPQCVTVTHDPTVPYSRQSDLAKVEWHAGELFPRVGFLVTNLKWQTKRVIRLYNRQGTAEQWIMERKNAVKWTKLSCRRFKGNEVRLELFALAYKLANSLRQVAPPRSIRSLNPTTLREKLVKIGAKVVTHARYVIFQRAEVAVPRQLFAAILHRNGRLRLACASG